MKSQDTSTMVRRARGLPMPSATIWLLLIAGLLVYAVKRAEFSRPTLVRSTAEAHSTGSGQAPLGSLGAGAPRQVRGRPPSRAAEPIDAGSGQAEPEAVSPP